MRPVSKDEDLTLAVVQRVVAAQRRGTLGSRVHVNRLPRQVVLDDVSDEDLAWVRKRYPGGVESRQGYRGRSRRLGIDPDPKARYDGMRYVVHLREPTGKHWDFTPRLEVWYERPHECQHYRGSLDAGGRPRWRCRECDKPVPVSRARALGLLPALARKSR